MNDSAAYPYATKRARTAPSLPYDAAAFAAYLPGPEAYAPKQIPDRNYGSSLGSSNPQNLFAQPCPFYPDPAPSFHSPPPYAPPAAMPNPKPTGYYPPMPSPSINPFSWPSNLFPSDSLHPPSIYGGYNSDTRMGSASLPSMNSQALAGTRQSQGIPSMNGYSNYMPYNPSAPVSMNTMGPPPPLPSSIPSSAYASSIPMHSGSFSTSPGVRAPPPMPPPLRNPVASPLLAYPPMTQPRPQNSYETALYIRTSADDAWDQHYRELLVYCSKKGTCNVPFSFVSDRQDHLLGRQHFHLGSWLSKQRGQHRRGVLAPEREAALQELVDKGLLSWDPKQAYDGTWGTRYVLLHDFKNKHGHTNVPLNYKINKNGVVVNLGEWVDIQRRLLREKKLQDDLHVKLEKLFGDDDGLPATNDASNLIEPPPIA